MFDWKKFEAAREIFSQVGPNRYRDDGLQHHLDLRPKELIKWMPLMKEDLGYLTLVDLVATDRSEFPQASGFRFELIYHFFNMENHQRVNFHVHANADEVLPSVRGFYPHAEWMEREAAEMFGLCFDYHTEALLLPHGSKTSPLRRSATVSSWPVDTAIKTPERRYNPNKSETPYREEKYAWKNFGLFSQPTMGNLEWLVCFDPAQSVQSKVKIGYHHQGFEKLLETKNWLSVMQLVDKLHLGSAPTLSIAWAKNLEDSLRIKLPERAQAIRIVLLELSRIAEHLTVMAEVALNAKQEEFKLLINAREKIFELFEKYCGHRQGFGVTRLGGVREDLPHGWVVEYQSIADTLLKNLKTIHASLTSKNAFRDHLQGTPVNAQTVLQWGITGPTMRAAGLNFDLRKSQPFYFYHDIDFDIPVGIFGTSYDRYLIRHEEIYQSFRIITQVLDNLPLGEILSPLEQDAVFDLKTGVLPLKQAPYWHYFGLESSNGEAGFFHLPKDGLTPYRVKVKSPSFILAQALPQLSIGLQEDQLRTCMASLGINKYELDR